MMWLRINKLNRIINLKMVKEISFTDNSLTFFYNNKELVIKKSDLESEEEWNELIEYLRGFEKYCC